MVHKVFFNSAATCSGQPSSVTKATIDIPSYNVDAAASITCEEGYRYPDGATVQEVKCVADELLQLSWEAPIYTECQRE